MIKNYIDMVTQLNNICENEETSVEMPGSYMEFNLRYSPFEIDLYCGDILLFVILPEEEITNKRIIDESIEAIEEKIEELEFAKSVLKFYLRDNR